jgi:NTP pyrophosphatase (non-canonical NTP hydrolase)
MNLIMFQQAAERTMLPGEPQERRMLNAALGLCEEAAEMVEVSYVGPPVEEAGDLLWYLAQMCKALDTSIAYLPDPTGEARSGNLVGLFHRTGYAAGLVKKRVFHQKPLDRDAMLRALADVLEYTRRYVGIYDVTIERAAALNVAKLLRRFPNGYNHADANARMDEQVMR